jgi:hypothetical protein
VPKAGERPQDDPIDRRIPPLRAIVLDARDEPHAAERSVVTNAILEAATRIFGERCYASATTFGLDRIAGISPT